MFDELVEAFDELKQWKEGKITLRTYTVEPVKKPEVTPEIIRDEQSISLRLPLWMLESIKTTANRQDVPYQSLIKVWLNEKLEEVHHGAK